MIKDIPDNEDLISEKSMGLAFDLVFGIKKRKRDEKSISEKNFEAEAGRDAKEGR